MKTAIGYVRVSHEEQAREGVSLGMQAEKIKAYCALNDLELIDICEDAGISAKNISGRPGFQAALDCVYGGQADGLLVWKLDRAFRSTQDALATAEKLNKRGKGLISICEKLDTTSAIGEFFFTLLASLAQMERKLIGERTAAALAQKRSNGQKTGGCVPYGFSVQDGQLIPNLKETAIIDRMKLFRAQGSSYQGIAEKLAENGIYNRRGRKFAETQIIRILKAAA